VAKVKVIKNSLNQNLNGEYFNDTPSNTIFSFGKFFVTTNFDGKVTIDYTDTLSSFVRPVTLETLGVNETQSEIIDYYTTNAVLNLDKSDLNTFVRFGSAYEFLRVSIQNVILAYPGSLFANSQKELGGTITYEGFSYSEVSNIATFYLKTGATNNTFGLVINAGNETIPDDKELKNLNLSYEKYVIWSSLEPDTLFPVVGYTGNTVNSAGYYPSGTTGSTPFQVNKYLKLEVEGNPFALAGTGDSASIDYHIRPNNVVFEEFRALLNQYEQNIVSKRSGTDGFEFVLKNPTLLEDGKIIYSDSEMFWTTGDGYNIDINTPAYQKFLKIVLTIGAKYDKVKTDLIARFLTPASLKTYDFTEEGKIPKLLRIYGREFDQIRQFIDSLVYINKVTYDKINNVPDQLIKNMANTFGWDYFSLVNESELVEGFLTVDDIERNLNEDILPAEIDVELWRRIINNTSYFWKSKGTRHAIKSMFLLIGIPEPFINITEYVYTVDGKIDPNTVPLTQSEFPSNSLPYDSSGYPVAPLETSDFYFQLSGNTDSGQAYLDVFRSAGFNLSETVDNKKSWVQAGATTRIHNTTPQYFQEDSKLVINTKEIDVALDTARGIEWDVWDYIQKDFAANSSGYTLPYSYVNISLPIAPVSGQTTFILPYNINEMQGDFEVRYNGILLNAPSLSGVSYTTEADYSISGNSFTLIGGVAKNMGTRRDVIQATLVTTGGTINSALSGVTVEYIVTRLQKVGASIYLDLPSYPRGDLQVTINGIALTKGTPQFTADYILDPANSSGGANRIILQNPDVITFLNSSPEVQVAYMTVVGSNDINLRSEIVRVDSFNSSKIYFNSGANKYVYKLNYKVTTASDVKFLINGIALEPIKDYNINVQNPYEIFLPKGIKFGDVIGAYYLVANSAAFAPVVGDNFGLGDISQLSFLEFIELIQRKMINARNRKVVTDFKGGWYPALLRIYETYLKRSLLPDEDPLQSNGYTFQNLYPFLSKYNAFFQRFVDQLLAATIIIKKGGLLIRNTVFTKQKHWYKRGVNVASGTTIFDMRGNYLLQYFGTDGSTFEIVQEILAPPPPPTVLYVETVGGILGSLTTGGYNILGFEEVIEYGIEYKRPDYPYGGSEPIGLQNLLEGINFEIEAVANNWTRVSKTIPPNPPLTANSFSMTLTGLADDADYQYRAFIQSLSTGATGNVRLIHTPVVLPTPSIETRTATAGGHLQGAVYYGRIINSGGINIVRYADVQFYATQYRKWNGFNWEAWQYGPTPPSNGPLGVNNFVVSNILNLDAGTLYQYRGYMKVGGVDYFGAIKSLTTLTAPIEIPETYTGPAQLITQTSFKASNNDASVFNPLITEYGTLYTASGALGTDANLKYGVGGISKVSTFDAGTDYADWFDNIISLSPDTTYYWRAFAKNGATDNDVGYGNVRSLTTLPEPPVYVSLSYAGSPPSFPEGNSHIYGNITTSRPLVTGEGFCLTLNLAVESATPSILSHNHSTLACFKRNTVTCATVSASVSGGDLGSQTDSDFLTKKIKIDSTSTYNAAQYCFCVRALSNAADYNTDYQNNAAIHMTSISNCCGGTNYQIGSDIGIHAYNTTNYCTGDGGGTIIQT